MKRSSKSSTRFSFKKGGFLLVFALAVAGLLTVLPNTKAQATVPDVQIQLGDAGNSHPSHPNQCANQLSGWGTTVNESKADCMQVRINNPASLYNQDFRVCLGITDGERCTPWASQGGGYSGNIINRGGFISFSYIRVDTQPSTDSYENVRIGVQLYYSEGGSGSCGGSSGMAWADANGATTSIWAYGAQRDDDPGCAQVGLYTSAVPVYDALYVSTTLPGSATPSTTYPGTITMRNTGNSTGIWTSDNVLASSSNCPDAPTALGQTCQDTKTFSSTRFQLQRTDTTPLVAPATLAYTRTITVNYSATRTRDCQYAMAPPSNLWASLWDKIIPTAYALPIYTCNAVYYYEWGYATQSQSDHILTTETGDFSTVPSNTFNITTPAAGGTYHLKYRMVSYPNAFFGQEADIPITVAGAPDFSFSCETASQTVTQGGGAAYTVRATSVGNFSGQVTVDVTAGMHATMSATTAVLNVPPGGFANSPDVSVLTQLSTPAVTYPLTFTATSPGYTSKTCQADLIVTVSQGPSVDISANPNPTPDGNTTLSWLISNSDTCEKISTPANASWGSSATPVSITPANGTQAVTLAANTIFTITCHRNGVNVSDSESVTLITNCAGTTVTPNLLTFTATQGGSGPAQQYFNVTSAEQASYSITTNKSWISLGANSMDFFVPNQTKKLFIGVNTTAGLSPNPDTAMVSIRNYACPNSVDRSVKYTLNSPGSFTLNCNSIAPSINATAVQGNSATWTIPYTTSGGLTTAITFSITTPPNATSTGSSTAAPPPASGSQPVTVNTTSSTPTGDYSLTVTGQSGSNTVVCTPVNLKVTSAIVNATVTAQCASANGGPFTGGPNPTCSLPASGSVGFIKWTSTGSADGNCGVTPNTGGDSMATTSTAANPSTPVQTQPLNNPPATHSFTVTCNSVGTDIPGTDTVTFNVPAGGSYNLHQSAKHLITVNPPASTTLAQLVALNTNPCDNQGRVLDTTYSFKENDTAVFAVNICNTGTADLVFNGGDSNNYSIQLADVLGNLQYVTGSAQANCGNDCALSNVDTSQAGKIIFTIQAKASGSKRLVKPNGSWVVFYNAVPKAPVNGTQPYYYFSNCISNITSPATPAMKVTNIPAAADIYNNIIGGSFDVPGFCLQALFSRSGTPPDRHEIAP
jgi:hypothetical protein